MLRTARSEFGFLASAEEHSNYKRIWARDGVICGLAAQLTDDESLLKTFKSTLQTLADHQHDLGHIPSNVHFKADGTSEVSYGGLAGRVDTISWFIIGVCNYCWSCRDMTFFKEMLPKILKGLNLLDSWEFNNHHLIYIPRSGNWADEYIIEGHSFYDQVLRLWALKCLNKLDPSERLEKKTQVVTNMLEGNYKTGNYPKPYHPNAYSRLQKADYWMASVNPSGYQTMFDALGNSLALLLDLGNKQFQTSLIKYSENLRKGLKMQLLPAFWEPILEGSSNWKLLKDNCKYEFRNHPYEFHNGGTWQMVNGFYGIAVLDKDATISAEILQHIEALNKAEDYGFYENFNTETAKAIGVQHCTWSAAGQIIVTQFINGKRFLI